MFIVYRCFITSLILSLPLLSVWIMEPIMFLCRVNKICVLNCIYIYLLQCDSSIHTAEFLTTHEKWPQSLLEVHLWKIECKFASQMRFVLHFVYCLSRYVKIRVTPQLKTFFFPHFKIWATTYDWIYHIHSAHHSTS